MKKSVFWIVLVFLLAISLVGTTCAAPAPAPAPEHEIVSINCVGNPLGSIGYRMSMACSQLIETTHPWLRLNSMEGLGTTANVYNMLTDPETWGSTMITCSHIDYFLASRGLTLFEETGPIPDVVDKVGLLGNHFIGVAGLYTLDPNIKTEQDLVGKRVALGKIGQVAWALIQTTVLKEVAEIDCQIDYLLPNTATQALIDGKADAAGILMVTSPDMSVMRPPGAYTIMEASGKTPYWITWSDETIKKAEATGWSPYVNPRLIPPGSFIGVQPDPLYLSYIVNGWALHKDFSEEVAYEFTKWYIENSADLGEIDKVADTFAKPEWLVSGMKQEWAHPGALRAYQEAGIPIGE